MRFVLFDFQNEFGGCSAGSWLMPGRWRGRSFCVRDKFFFMFVGRQPGEFRTRGLGSAAN